MKEFLERLRTAFLAILVVISVSLGIVRLMTVQIVNGDAYLQQSEYTSVYTQDIKAVRGQIVDADGDPIIGNKIGFSVIIDDTYFPSDNKEANEIIIQTVNILKEAGLKYNETIPISAALPYEFKKNMDGDIEKLKSLIGVNVYATAENCIDKLIDDYEISAEDYNQQEQRTIAGIRYEMKLRDFSLRNPFTLCTDVPIDIVTKLKELSVRLKGIDVSEDAVREIRISDIIPHEIGTVGPIYAEQYEELKKKGYAMNDTVGKGGIEQALESELRGKDGTRTINLVNGEVTSAEITEEPVGGHTVKLTINSEFQRDLQDILTNFMSEIRGQYAYRNVNCGAIVVLDVSSNAVLGMATAPTYDLKDYSEHYEEIAEGENHPLLNRATIGLYRPGSTFKTITATAGLNEGIITGYSTFKCENKAKFWDIDNWNCTGWHNDIAVASALRVSCNIFFYELGRRLGIDKIAEYAELYGYGSHTGIETWDEDGQIGTPETFDKLGIDWTVGQVLNAAIGQSETNVTPLQMAGVASTIANRGVRYKTHLVDSIYDYPMDNVLKKSEPEIAKKINLNYDYVYDFVIDGMVQASGNNFPEAHSLSDLGFSVAIKTGTPQNWRNGNEITDSCFIGFAPAYEPKIAFAGMIEEGEYSKYMIRSIIQAYYKEFSENGYYPGGSIAYLPDRPKKSKNNKENQDSQADESSSAESQQTDNDSSSSADPQTDSGADSAADSALDSQADNPENE